MTERPNAARLPREASGNRVSRESRAADRCHCADPWGRCHADARHTPSVSNSKTCSDRVTRANLLQPGRSKLHCGVIADLHHEIAHRDALVMQLARFAPLGSLGSGSARNIFSHFPVQDPPHLGSCSDLPTPWVERLGLNFALHRDRGVQVAFGLLERRCGICSARRPGNNSHSRWVAQGKSSQCAEWCTFPGRSQPTWDRARSRFHPA